ncbi:MAG: subtilisin-like proprotein convertase family protein [Cognaticolwellia sp.]|jgi:subtilisin-like proprotein convertase family protein
MNKFSTLLVLAFFLPLFVAAQSTNFWSDVAESNITKTGERQIVPLQYRTVKLNIDDLKQHLAAAPMEDNVNKSSIKISLPMPDGTIQRFSIVESPIMEAGLAIQLPEIKTYLGKGIDDPTATVRFDWTYKGFHAMIITAGSWSYIDPYNSQTQSEYISYYKKHFVTTKSFQCDLDDEISGVKFKENLPRLNQNKSVGEQLRTYRLALACTGEYAQFHGGTVNSVASAMTTTMNRVNGVYENEVAVRLILVANNNSLIFLNSSTDPFSNDNTGQLIGQSQAQITNIIGTNNFDIGHVFSTGAGGLAGLGVICRNNSKGRGVTGISQPIGDPFDIDYVAHEIGHQFGGNHTFNGSSGSCTFNIANSAAYEPGSGTTIMAYAGICAGQNTANNSDAYFHTHSFDEIIAYSTQGNGNNCPNITNTGNSAPVVTAGTGGFSIPKSTPFELVGTATDPDNHPMTYAWEEHDLGPQGAPNSPSGNAPIFRSFSPVNIPARTFPQISDIVNNAQTMGEILPDVARNLEFRLTARDNQPGGGGVTYDVINFSVAGSAGPFLVTEPNTNQTVWTEGAIGQVTWDIANTDAAPVNCSEVDILLSIDGGYTYTYTLATNVPNTGSYATLVPLSSATNQARIKVQAADNIFFDISDQNFTIQAPTTPDYIVWSLEDEQTVCAGTDATFSFALISLLNYSDDVNLIASGVPNGVTLDFNSNPAIPGDTVRVNITNTDNTITGLYPITIQINSNSSNQTQILNLTIYSSDEPIVNITSPINGDRDVPTTPLLEWEAPGGAIHTYEIRVSDTPYFTNIIESATNISTTSYLVTGLDPYSIYYWQVKASNQCQTGDWSTVNAFRTTLSTCETFDGSEQKSIIGGIIFTYESDLTIPTNLEITSLNVIDSKFNHQRVSDISLALRSPAGTEVVLMSPRCQNVSGPSTWTLDFSDDSPNATFVCTNTVNTDVQPVAPLANFNGESAQGTWKMLITDSENGSGGSFQGYELEVCYAVENSNADPILVTNDTLKIAIGGSQNLNTELLLSTDTDNSAAELTYTLLSATSKGTLTLNGTALNIGSTFTQTDIDNGNLTYQHTGIEAEVDAFQFDVRDTDGGWYGTPYFTIKTGESAGIATVDNPFALYPNPASSVVNINLYLETEQDVTIWIFDAIGRMVQQYEFSNVVSGSQIFELPVENLSSGNYVIRIESEELSKTEKIMVVK